MRILIKKRTEGIGSIVIQPARASKLRPRVLRGVTRANRVDMVQAALDALEAERKPGNPQP